MKEKQILRASTALQTSLRNEQSRTLKILSKFSCLTLNISNRKLCRIFFLVKFCLVNTIDNNQINI